MTFENYAAFSRWLESKGVFHMDLGLERMENALGRLQHIAWPIVQVLGTNGKGSTSVFIQSLAMAHDLNCGTFLSPHFLSPRERILLNGEAFSEEVWLIAARDLVAALGDAADELTYFEFLTLLAIVLFRRSRVDLAIFEAGLGGAHDATTALKIQAQCYTPIALDHEKVLGRGLENIAADKAKAMRPGTPVFSAPQYPAARKILAAAATERRAPITFVEPLGHDAKLGLEGGQQRTNASVALACWHWLVEKFLWPEAAFDKEKLARGLRNAFIPGRMQFISKSADHGALILDGAHNCHAVQTLLNQLKIRPAAVIFSALADKNWRPSIALLERLNVPIYIVQLPGERAEKASEIAAAVPGAIIVEGEQPMCRALDLAPSPALICGSLYLLAEFYKLFPQYLEKPC